jgi:hypothetical protein
MKLTSGTNGTTLDTLAVPNAKNLSQFYGSGGQMSKGRVAPASLKAYGGMVSDYMMDNLALPVLKGPPLKPVLFAKAKGGKVSKLKRGGVF